MEYLLGGCTGLLKEVETTNKTLLRLSQISEQSLYKNVTCLCWSGSFGGYFEDELTVGYKDGTLRSYNYLTMKVNREYKLDSKCIYITMLNYHFDIFSPEVYNRNINSNLYPNTKRPNIYNTNDRLLLAVSEGGYIYIFDWSVEKCHNVATVKYLYKTKEIKLEKDINKEKNNNYTSNNKNKNNKENINDNNKEKVIKMDKEDNNNKKNKDNISKVEELKEFIGALFVYKYKSPLSDAKVHSLMKNRLIIAGPNNPPILFDIFSESILWIGKFPHDTVLGLQSKLDISSICFLEEIDDDIICVATDDSFIYIYDLKAQKDPVFEFNICDYRTIGLSKRLLSLPHEDFNTKHRKTLSRAINEKYSQNNRKILKLTIKPSYKLYFPKLDNNNINKENNNKENNKDNNNTNKEDYEQLENEDNLYKINEYVYIKNYNSVKKDYCNLYISDNFGTIYNLQFLTGNRLLQWIYKKIQPLIDQKLSVNSESDPSSTIINDGRAKRPLEHNINIDNKGNQNNKNNKYNKKIMNLDDIKNLNDKDKYKIVEYLLEARKRLCTSSNNDKKIHFRRNHYNQFICRILCCYNFHNGSVIDLKCLGEYLISAGLDRFSNIINIKTGKLVFRQYCNQKQTYILIKNKYLFKTFQDNIEFKLNNKDNNNENGIQIEEIEEDKENQNLELQKIQTKYNKNKYNKDNISKNLNNQQDINYLDNDLETKSIDEYLSDELDNNNIKDESDLDNYDNFDLDTDQDMEDTIDDIDEQIDNESEYESDD